MPEGLIPNEGLARGLWRTLVNPDTQLNAWQLMLFVNDITPNADTVLADLVEPSWIGYARFPLSPSGWGEPTLVVGLATSEWGVDPIVFTNSVGPTETVYGCAYADPLFNVLRFVQRFDPSGIRPVAAGDSVQIIPRFSRIGFLP